MSSNKIEAHLFGALTIYRDKKQLDISGSRAARALLAFLLLHRDYPQSRDRIAGFLWPDMDENRSRRSLTQALWRIRKLLPENLEADAQHIRISDSPSITVDVEVFESLAGSYSPSEPPSHEERETNIQSLYQAVELYRGELLEGFYDDWVLVERERFRELYLRSLEHLVAFEKCEGNYDRALGYALKVTQSDPYREAVHREVMRLYYALNRPEAALSQYETCCKILEDEFSLEADQQTRALAQEIAIRVPSVQTPFLPKAVSSIDPWSLDNSQPAQLPLIGRAKDRETIIHQLENTIKGFGGILLVEGEAGIGKTRLLFEIERDAQWHGIQTLWGYNLEGRTSSPFGAISGALSSGMTSLRINQLSQLVEEIWLSVLLPHIPQLGIEFPNLASPPSLTAAQEYNRLVQAFANLLSTWGKITPLLLILEDLHWSNEDSINLLIALAPYLKSSRVIIIGTYRREDAQIRSGLWEKISTLERVATKQQICLERLNSKAVAELIRRSLRLSEAAPLFEKRLYRETQGNPLFILETLRALHDQGLLVRDQSGYWHTPWDDITLDYGELPLPEAVERTISTRLERLSPDESKVLSAAAVLAQDFNFSLLSSTADMKADQVLSIANTLVRRRFLEETSNAYQFSHEKIRQVAYGTIPQEERRRMHRRAARSIEALTIESEDYIEILAHHFHLGEVWDQAAIYNQRAGERAKRMFANREAAIYFSRALEALEKIDAEVNPVQQYELYLARESVHALLGEREAQENDLTALDALLNDLKSGAAERHLQVTLRWAAYWESISNYPAALEAVREATNLAKMTDDLLSIQKGHLKWGQMLGHNGEYAKALDHLETAYQLGLESQDACAQAACLNALSVVAFNRGDYDNALEYSRRALEKGKSTGDGSILADTYINLGNVFHYLADFSAAIEHYQRGLELCQSLGDRRFKASTLYHLSIVYYDNGDLKAARQNLEQVCALTKEIGDRRSEGYGWVLLGLVLESIGELKKGRDAYRRGLELRRAVGLHAMAIDPLAGLARVATAEGKPDEAVKYANQVLTWMEENGHEGIGDPLLAYQGVYRALLTAGETEQGLAVLEDAYALLMKFADSIADPEYRHAYLHEISPGQDIWEDYHHYILNLPIRREKVHLPSIEAPLGRPLVDDEYIEITWTIETPQDYYVEGKVAKRRHRLLRLLEEAQSQGASPTVGDLASALDVCDRTIKRDIAALRQAGHSINTRGSH